MSIDHCEPHLHQAYTPCAIGAIPSQTYGNALHTLQCVCVCDRIAPITQGLQAW